MAIGSGVGGRVGGVTKTELIRGLCTVKYNDDGDDEPRKRGYESRRCAPLIAFDAFAAIVAAAAAAIVIDVVNDRRDSVDVM